MLEISDVKLLVVCDQNLHLFKRVRPKFRLHLWNNFFNLDVSVHKRRGLVS